MTSSAQTHTSKDILGVVLAGGQSRRFGSDKAAAMLNGQTLMQHAIAALSGECDRVVVSGRGQASVDTVADWPEPGLGPLGGLAGALLYAQEHGYHSILTCGVDSVGLPADLRMLLSPAPAFLKEQPVIGHWPISILPQLQQFIAGDETNALWRFGKAVGARPVKIDHAPANINSPPDLDELRDPKQK